MRLAQVITCFDVQLTIQRQLQTACTIPCKTKKTTTNGKQGEWRT